MNLFSPKDWVTSVTKSNAITVTKKVVGTNFDSTYVVVAPLLAFPFVIPHKRTLGTLLQDAVTTPSSAFIFSFCVDTLSFITKKIHLLCSTAQ